MGAGERDLLLGNSTVTAPRNPAGAHEKAQQQGGAQPFGLNVPFGQFLPINLDIFRTASLLMKCLLQLSVFKGLVSKTEMSESTLTV